MGGPNLLSRLSSATLVRGASVELPALVTTAAVVRLLRSNGLRMGWRAFKFTVLPMLGSLPRILLAGAGLHLRVAALGRERRSAVRAYWFSFLRPASLAGWLRVCAAFMLITFGYAW